MSASNRPNFTPGPWELEAGRSFKTSSGSFFLAYGKEPESGRALFPDFVELDCNARLISAAPEMFEALRALRECETQYVNGAVWVKAGTANLDAVCAALAKAEGRA